MKNKNVKILGKIKANVEELAAVELAAIIGLLYNEDAVPRDEALRTTPPEEGLHVRGECCQMRRPLLLRVQISKANDDAH